MISKDPQTYIWIVKLSAQGLNYPDMNTLATFNGATVMTSHIFVGTLFYVPPLKVTTQSRSTENVRADDSCLVKVAVP